MLSSILVVEDDLDDVEIIKDAFESLRYSNVTYCTNASEAIDYLESVADEALPSLIVTDHSIPPGDGFEFVKSLKKIDKYALIEVVVFSGFVPEESKQKLLNVGVTKVINKPRSFPEYLAISLTLTQIADQQQSK